MMPLPIRTFDVIAGRRARRGSALYVTVLFTTLIVSLLALTGLAVVRIERRQMMVNHDCQDARANARSAVELALRVLANDSNWRTTYTNGVETMPQSLGANGRGSLSWILEDADGSLLDADTRLRLKGIGRVNDSIQVSSVEVTSYRQPLNCLEVAVCSNGSMNFDSNAVVTTNQKISSNASVAADTNASVNSDVEAVGPITGDGLYSGSTTTPVPARTLPSASVWDNYIASGTAINYTAIPKVGPDRAISDVVLSPSNNPYGATNPQGIYVIDCQGGLIRIQYSRIIGTLVLIDPAPISDVIFEVSWEPAMANYPALLVQGGMEFRIPNTPLDEAVRGVNFNPPGSPYQGASDTDQVDTYPSLIKGLVYLSGNANIANDDAWIQGTLVVGGQLTVNASDRLTVTYDPIHFSDPPPGFFLDDQILVTPGSWLWDAAP